MNPVSLWENLLYSAGTVPGAGEPLIDDDTTTRWQPSDGDTITFLGLKTRPITHVGIAAHNLGFTGASLLIETGDGTNWQTLATITTVDNQAALIPVGPATADAIRITAQGNAISVGILYIGEALEFERPFYQGHTPIVFAEQNTRTVKNSVGGQYAGNSVKRRSRQTSVNISNLSPQFIRARLEPFRQHYNSGGRFFFSWYPDKYSADAVYAHGSGVMSPTNTGPAALMGVSFDIMAYTIERLECSGQIYAGNDPIFADDQCVVVG